MKNSPRARRPPAVQAGLRRAAPALGQAAADGTSFDLAACFPYLGYGPADRARTILPTGRRASAPRSVATVRLR